MRETEKARLVPAAKGPVRAAVTLPGSKSVTNRALPIAALAHGETLLKGALFSDDSRYCIEALRSLGYGVETDAGAAAVRVRGRGTEPLMSGRGGDLFVGNSGTASRFLTAFVALGRGNFRIDGVARMRERPIADLLAALRLWGVDARDELGTGCPPVLVRANGIPGGETVVRGESSSQYATALLLAAPCAARESVIAVAGELVSAPYVRMTVAMMEDFGVAVETGDRSFRVRPQAYRAREYQIEPDASGASYFLAAAAVTGGEVTIAGLSGRMLQGDAAFAGVLERMGCEVARGPRGLTLRGPAGGLRGIDVDLFDMSDTVPTLAAIAPLASAPVTIRNVANVRLKETDRLRACAAELRKFGVAVEEFADGLRIEPRAELRSGVEVETYDDHRMAMSFAVLGLRAPGTAIRDPGCVAKTFPDFLERFERMLRDVG